MERKKGIPVDRVVLHRMEGTFPGTIAWFKNGKRPVPTCAHYLVSFDGDICQMVADEQKCYHAGNYNSRSIGIEHEGYTGVADGTIPQQRTPARMLEASARIVAVMAAKFSFPPDREHVIGHYEVPGATHTDPGKHWPWDEYMRRVLANYQHLQTTGRLPEWKEK